jgi:acyl-CoA-binding protein
MSEFDEDDDLEEEFSSAANYIQNNHSKFNRDDLLKFYGYYKQATVGKCNTSRPGMFNFQEKAKWDAWNALGGMEKEEAQSLYIEHLNSVFPDWSSKKEAKKSGGAFGASVSRPKIEITESSENSIQDFVKQGNLEELEKSLLEIDASSLNSLDDEGLGLLHWAADRGNPEILTTLLKQDKIDMNLRDSDGQTPLFYASSCGHSECVKILLEHKADKSILDNDNSTCLDVAFDDKIRELLS